MPDRPAGKRSGRGQRPGPAEPAEAADAAEAAALELLSKGDIEVEGRLANLCRTSPLRELSVKRPAL